MMPSSSSGLEADLFAIKPASSRAPTGAAAADGGKAFSNELKERIDSRSNGVDESEPAQDDVALSEADEKDELAAEELDSEEEVAKREADGDDEPERQETVAEEAEAGEGEGDEGGNILPFMLASLPQTEARPLSVTTPTATAAVDADAQGEMLLRHERGPAALLDRQWGRAQAGPLSTAELDPELAEAPLDPKLSAGVERRGPNTLFQGAMDTATAVAAKSRPGAEAELAGLRAASEGSLLRDTLSGTGASSALNATAAAAAASTSASTPVVGGSNPASLIQLPVQAPLQQPGWDKAMGERMVWMARNNVQEAHLQLNPRHLGPIEVRLNIQQDQAQVSFVAANPQAREALENSMPRLREMFADQGLNLGQADVHSREQQKQQAGQGNAGGRGAGLAADEAEGGMGASPMHSAPLPVGRLDFYA